MMVRFPQSSYPAVGPQEGSARPINCYPELIMDVAVGIVAGMAAPQCDICTSKDGGQIFDPAAAERRRA